MKTHYRAFALSEGAKNQHAGVSTRVIAFEVALDMTRVT